MADRYQLDGHDISLNTSDTLGNGGQAVVTKYGDQAIKIWKTVEPDQARKVEYLLRNKPRLPDTFLLPHSRVTKHGALVGYSMDLLPGNFREGGVLFNRTLRKELKINTPTLLSIVDSARAGIDLVHGEKIVIGDVSGRNVAFVVTRNGIKTYWYDTDSWQVGGFRCPVWTEYFLCPDLYDQARKGNITFTEQSDWYSFNTIFFWSLLNVNPYDQIHPKYPDFRERARAGIWLFSPGIHYPKLCPHPDTVSDDLLHHFETVFVKHLYLPVSTKDIRQYQQSLIECPSCGAFYPNTRPACPACTVKTQAADFHPIYHYESLIKGTGEIIFSKFQSGTLFAISQEKTGLFLSIRPPSSPAVKTFIDFDTSNGVYHFDIVGGEYLAINEDGNEMVYLTPIGSPGSSWITSSTSVYLGNRRAAFRGTSQGLLHQIGSALLRGEVRNGYLVDETLPIDLAGNQSWFWTNADGKKIVTVSRVFSEYLFQLVVDDKNRFEVKIPRLENTDSLQDLIVHFGSNSICLRRIVNRKGRLIVLTDVIDLFGQVVFSSSHLSSKFPGQNHHVSTFENSTVYWPTDQGIIMEDVIKNTFPEISNTAKIADSSDKLVHLGGGKHFLVVRERQINYLRL